MTFNLALVAQHLNPTHAIRIGPDRIVDAREVHGQLASLLFEEMGKQEAHLKECKRKLSGPHHRIPRFWGRWHEGRSRNVFVECIGSDASHGSHSPDEHS